MAASAIAKRQRNGGACRRGGMASLAAIKHIAGGAELISTAVGVS